MTPEFWAIIAVGVSLGALNVATLQMINKRIDDTNKLIDQRFDAVNRRIDDTNKLIDQRFNDVNKRIDDTNRRIEELSSDVKQLTSRVTELEKGQAAMGGLLNGLRESLFERAREGAGSPPA